MSIAWKAITAEQLDRLYWRQEMSDVEISLMFGVSVSAVAAKRQRLGVAGRGKGRTPAPLRDTGRALRMSAPFLR
jgi:hypothetical protein